MAGNTVFISYAKEDSKDAERLYMDLRSAQIDAWMDTKRLLPGQDWKHEIKRAIKEAAVVIVLISEHSVNKRGFVQSEMKKALESLEEVPKNQIFLIQARLDKSAPVDEELQNLHWVDLFPDYNKGLQRILSALEFLETSPLEMRGSEEVPGLRAPIEYTPYRSFAEFARDFVQRLPSSDSMADREYAIYLTFVTNREDVQIPEQLKREYPQSIRIVLQNQFEQLRGGQKALTVVLWFSGEPATLKVPYDALSRIEIPAIGLSVQHYGLPVA